MLNNAQFHLLVVDDDQIIIDSLKYVLPKHWRMTAVQDPKNLGSRMIFHAAFVDMHLSTQHSIAEGPDIIAKVSAANPQTDIIAMSGDLSLPLMEACLKAGARKFIAKPFSNEEVLATLDKIEALWMQRTLESRGGNISTRWIGSSKESRQIRESLASLRGENGPILIEGETGTGKEVAFKILNQQEGSRPFVAVNIAAIPENLFESEFFGHTKGAFTGADSNKIGLAEAAGGGDLFLDEIEALSLNHQVKLLRFLETGELRRVGAKDTHLIRCRVVAASNQPLRDLVAQGKFREDLYFRLSGKQLQLPPLRSRKTDISELADFFLSLERPRVNKKFSDDAIESLRSHKWPGNVRELKRVCEQVALYSPLPLIRPEDLKSIFPTDMVHPATRIDFSRGLSTLVQEFEANLIRQCISDCQNVDKAAEIMGVSRSNLYKKLKDYNIAT